MTVNSTSHKYEIKYSIYTTYDFEKIENKSLKVNDCIIQETIDKNGLKAHTLTTTSRSTSKEDAISKTRTKARITLRALAYTSKLFFFLLHKEPILLKGPEGQKETNVIIKPLTYKISRDHSKTIKAAEYFISKNQDVETINFDNLNLYLDAFHSTSKELRYIGYYELLSSKYKSQSKFDHSLINPPHLTNMNLDYIDTRYPDQRRKCTPLTFIRNCIAHPEIKKQYYEVTKSSLDYDKYFHEQLLLIGNIARKELEKEYGIIPNKYKQKITKILENLKIK